MIEATYRAQRLKHRGTVETIYTFAVILLGMTGAPILLMVLLSSAAALLGWQVNDSTSYAVMGNIIILTLILAVLDLLVWVIGYVLSAHPPVPGFKNKNGVAPSHDTVTTPLQD